MADVERLGQRGESAQNLAKCGARKRDRNSIFLKKVPVTPLWMQIISTSRKQNTIETSTFDYESIALPKLLQDLLKDLGTNYKY